MASSAEVANIRTERPVPDAVTVAEPSLNQQFVCLFDADDGSGPFGPRYHLVHGWRVSGSLDEDCLRAAVGDVIERHDALRTRLIRGPEPRQEIHPTAPATVTVREMRGLDRDARAAAVDELLCTAEAGTLDVDELPHLRCLLVRFSADDALVVLVVHHIAADGFSMRLLIRDLANRYAAHRGLEVPGLPPAPSYRDYAQWQRSLADAPGTDAARRFWARYLDGAATFTIPTDHRRSEGLLPRTGWYRFEVDPVVATRAQQLARTTNSSPFMVLYTAFALTVAQLQQSPDVTVPTFSPGRGQPGNGFDDMVGPCFNFLPLRTDLASVSSFREALSRVRRSCLQGYGADLPSLLIFGEAPTLMAPAMADDAAAAVFQVFPYPHLLDHDTVGDVEYTEVRARLRSQEVGSEVPDGTLWTLNLERDGMLSGHVQYRTNLYEVGTVTRWADAYLATLAHGVGAPDGPLVADQER